MENIIFTTPKIAGVDSHTNAPIVAITYLESGYKPFWTTISTEDLNGALVTPEIQESAVVGSNSGTHLIGYLMISRNELKAVLGIEASDEDACDNGEAAFEFGVKFSDGKKFTFYDRNEIIPVDGGQQYKWHIGGEPGTNADQLRPFFDANLPNSQFIIAL